MDAATYLKQLKATFEQALPGIENDVERARVEGVIFGLQTALVELDLRGLNSDKKLLPGFVEFVRGGDDEA